MILDPTAIAMLMALAQGSPERLPTYDDGVSGGMAAAATETAQKVATKELGSKEAAKQIRHTLWAGVAAIAERAAHGVIDIAARALAIKAKIPVLQGIVKAVAEVAKTFVTKVITRAFTWLFG